MKRWLHYVVIGIIICITVLFAIYFGDKYTYTISSPFVFCLFFIILWFGGLSVVDYCRERTTHVFYNFGHKSILSMDVVEIPWQEYLCPGKKLERLGDITLLLTGGIQYWGFYFHGGVHDPIIIFPEKYKGIVKNNLVVYANVSSYNYEQLPEYIQLLLSLYPRRYVEGKTPIFYGVTADFDGSSTPPNLDLERQLKHANTEITQWKNRHDRLRGLFRAEKDQWKREYFGIGEELKPVNLEE